MPTARQPLLPVYITIYQGGSLTSGSGAKKQAPAPAGGGQPGQTQQPTGKQPTPSCAQPLLVFLPFLVILYFLVLRPQQKQEKQRRQMIGALKKGDDVVTNGGIHGQVTALGEATVTIKFGSDAGQRFKIDRSAIQRVIPKDQPKNGEPND